MEPLQGEEASHPDLCAWELYTCCAANKVHVNHTSSMCSIWACMHACACYHVMYEHLSMHIIKGRIALELQHLSAGTPECIRTCMHMQISCLQACMYTCMHDHIACGRMRLCTDNVYVCMHDCIACGRTCISAVITMLHVDMRTMHLAQADATSEYYVKCCHEKGDFDA